MEKYILFYLLALFAEILGTLSGFGSSILFVPLASMFFDFKQVLGITAIFHVFSNLSKIVLFQKGMNKNIILKLGIPAVIFVIIGGILSKYVPKIELEIIMCVVLILISIFLLIYSDKKIAKTNQNLVISGVFSGFFAGLIGSGGAIRGLALSGFQIEKDIFIATSAVIDLGVDSSRAIIYILYGYIGSSSWSLILGLIITSFIGSYTGKKILVHISQPLFKKIVLYLILITSIVESIKILFFK